MAGGKKTGRNVVGVPLYPLFTGLDRVRLENLYRRHVPPRGQFVQGNGQAVQLGEVGLGQLRNQPVALAGQGHSHYPGVPRVRATAHQAGQFGPVDQLHCAVMAQQEVTSEVTDRRWLSARMAFDGHQQLVLDMGKPSGPGLALAPMLKTSQADAER